MIEIYGDFWKHAIDYNVLVCTTNMVVKSDGRLVMGKGIAADFRNRFPQLDWFWGQRLLNNQHNHGMMSTKVRYRYKDEEGRVREKIKIALAFPTKYNWVNDSSVPLIHEGLKNLAALNKINNYSSVLMTRPGCGNGNKNWEQQIKPMVKRLLDDTFTVISK